MATHDLPKTLKHKPILSVDYEDRDRSMGYGDVEYLSIGRSQWDNNYMSAKTLRWDDANDKWAREADEMPLYRVLDLAILIADAIQNTGEAQNLLGNIAVNESDKEHLMTFLNNNSSCYQKQINCLRKILSVPIINLKGIIRVAFARFKNYKIDTLYNADNIYLYKIIPYEYAKPILLEDKIRLNQVRSWEDQNELFLFKQHITYNGVPVEGLGDLSKRIYGQCWSLCMDCEAAWHAYGQGRDCVRIITTLGKLIRFFYTEPNDKLITYMGQIQYMTSEEMQTWMNANKSKISSPQTINEVATDSLFIKKSDFKYEKEFRIVQFYADNPRIENGQYVVEPYDEYKEISNNNVSNLISCVEFDGRLEKEEYGRLKNELERDLKMAGKTIKIKRSQLYDAPNYGMLEL